MVPKPSIALINTDDSKGGAAKIATSLRDGFLARKLRAELFVGYKQFGNNEAIEIPGAYHVPSFAKRVLLKTSQTLFRKSGIIRGANLAARILRDAAFPESRKLRNSGLDDFHYPGTQWLIDTLPKTYNLLNLHNLHGYYFDLQLLPQICKVLPTVITLHDQWLFTGHCAHSLDCARWLYGCGECPYLWIPYPIKFDNTARNFQTKETIFKQSSFAVIAPSKWLMDRVDNSILNEGARAKRVIPNGVNQNIFKPGNKLYARQRLNFDLEATIVLYIANRGRKNAFKDNEQVETLFKLLAKDNPTKKIIFITLGDKQPDIVINQSKLISPGYIYDQSKIAQYYQSADLYLHLTKADTFPTTIIEAMSSGLPVIGTAVGGVVEQIDDGITGYLVQPGNMEELITKCKLLLFSDRQTRDQMGLYGLEKALLNYSSETMVSNYLDFFNMIYDAFQVEGQNRSEN